MNEAAVVRMRNVCICYNQFRCNFQGQLCYYTQAPYSTYTRQSSDRAACIPPKHRQVTFVSLSFSLLQTLFLQGPSSTMSSSSSAYTDQASALLRACKSKIIKVCKNQRQTIKPRLLALINEAKDPQQLLETLKPHVTARSKQLFEAAVEKCRIRSIESDANDPVGGLFSLLRIFNELANDIFAEDILGEESKGISFPDHTQFPHERKRLHWLFKDNN